MAGSPFPLWAKIDIAAAATTEIIPAPGANTRLEIGLVFCKAGGANTVVWKAGSTAMTGAISEAANSGEVVNMAGAPIKLPANTAFNLTTTETAQLSGIVNYRKVPA
jgi:hypothetical protein